MTTEIAAEIMARSGLAIETINDHLPGIHMAAEVLRQMLDGKVCAHDTGVCYCVPFAALDRLERADSELSKVALMSPRSED